MPPTTNSIKQFAPYIATKFFKAITLFGSSFFYLFILVFLFRLQPQLAIKVLAAFTTVEISTGILKLIYPKNRPAHNGNRKTMLEKYEAGSFPSIHSARSMVMAILGYQLFPNDPILIILMICLALVIGYSRIHLKRHYLVDVVAGYSLGFIIGYLFILS